MAQDPGIHWLCKTMYSWDVILSCIHYVYMFWMYSDAFGMDSDAPQEAYVHSCMCYPCIYVYLYLYAWSMHAYVLFVHMCVFDAGVCSRRSGYLNHKAFLEFWNMFESEESYVLSVQYFELSNMYVDCASTIYIYIYPLFVHNVHDVNYLFTMLCMFIICPLYIHYLATICPRFVRYVHHICPLSVHFSSSIRPRFSLYVYISTICPRFVHYMYLNYKFVHCTVCPVAVPYL